MVDFRLLGPVEVDVNGRVVDIGPPQRRTVLAALAVDAGRPVAVEALIDRVWAEEPPDGARRSVHAHIARIRRVLEQVSAGRDGEGPVFLVRRGGEYLLDVEPDRVDLYRFRALAARAREPGRTEAERVAALRGALALWRGTPLRGLPGPWAARVRESWQCRRLDVLVAWAIAELRAQPDPPIISQLQDLIGEFPLTEPLVAALMRALHAALRSAEALDCYAITRKRLAEELGTEPGAELRGLHRSILRGEHPSASSQFGSPSAYI